MSKSIARVHQQKRIALHRNADWKNNYIRASKNLADLQMCVAVDPGFADAVNSDIVGIGNWDQTRLWNLSKTATFSQDFVKVWQR